MNRPSVNTQKGSVDTRNRHTDKFECASRDIYLDKNDGVTVGMTARLAACSRQLLMIGKSICWRQITVSALDLLGQKA